MHQYLCYSPTHRQDAQATFGLFADPKLCRNFSRHSISHLSLSSAYLPRTRNHGVLLFGFPQSSKLNLQFNPSRVDSATTRCFSASEDPHKEGEPTRKVNWTSVSIAVTLGVAVLARAGAAIASSQLSLPAITRSPVVIQSGRELLVSAWMGLMAGCLHTLTGPDHLAALAPLSIGRTKLQSVAVGALWGCGHDAGQVIFGILFLLLKGKLQIEVLRTWGARVVGMTLVAIGVTGLKEAQEAAVVPILAGNSNTLAPTSLPHMESFSGGRRNVGFATFATGIVHGLQPDALIMILPALALPSRIAGAAFLSMFLAGTVLSMSFYTAFIGSCSSALQKRIPRITEHLAWGSSMVAILVGVGILAGELFGLSIF